MVLILFDMDYSESLKNLGVTKEQFLVYKAILEDPSLSITSLADKTGIHRSTIYRIIDELKSFSLLKVNTSESEPRWKAALPEKLIDIGEQKKLQLQKDLDIVKKEIPFLSSLASFENIKDKLDVTYIKGGLEIYNEIDKPLKSATQTLSGFTTWEIIKQLDNELDAEGNILHGNAYLEAMMKYGDKFIFPGTEEEIQAFKGFIERHPMIEDKFQARWIDPEELHISANTIFFDEYSVLATKKNNKLFGYIIKNELLAQTLRSISLYLWEHANPIY